VWWCRKALSLREAALHAASVSVRRYSKSVWQRSVSPRRIYGIATEPVEAQVWRVQQQRRTDPTAAVKGSVCAGARAAAHARERGVTKRRTNRQRNPAERAVQRESIKVGAGGVEGERLKREMNRPLYQQPTMLQHNRRRQAVVWQAAGRWQWRVGQKCAAIRQQARSIGVRAAGAVRAAQRSACAQACVCVAAVRQVLVCGARKASPAWAGSGRKMVK